MEDIKKKMLCELENLIGHFEQRISKLEGEILDHKNSIDTLQSRCDHLEKNNTDLVDELENMKKVSIIKTLNTRLTEKDGEIAHLKTRINALEQNSKSKIELVNEVTVKKEEAPEPVKEASPAPAEEPEPEPEASTAPVEEASPEPAADQQESDNESGSDEEEVSVSEKKLRGKMYYVTDDDEKQIYEKLEDGDIGDLVGKYNEKNRPVFFKKK